MKKRHLLPALTLAVATQAALAAGGHDHGHDGHGAMEMQGMSGEMFLEKRQIGGYTVSFHVMKAQPGMEHGGSHNFMVKVEKDGQVVKGVKINSKVIHPNGESQSKMLMAMGDWHMAGYDLGHDGRHQLLILFKTPDGKKHKGGVYYP